jgi:hypothetical protein
LERQSPQIQENIKKKRQELTDKRCQWILGSKKPTTICESLLGLVNMETQDNISTASLSRHLKEMKETNPLKKIWNANFSITTNPNLITQRILPHPWVTEFNVLKKDKESDWKAFIRKKKIESLERNHGKMARYIQKRARRGDLADCIVDSPKGIQTKALNWRTNQWFHGKVCRCHKTFTRNHVDSCFTIPLSDLEERKFKEDSEQLQKSMGNHSYNKLDFLLNERKFSRFDEGLGELSHFLD